MQPCSDSETARNEPLTAPGVPNHYPAAKKLVTEDCIKPAGAELPLDTADEDTSTAESAAKAAHFYSIHEKPVPYRTK